MSPAQEYGGRRVPREQQTGPGYVLTTYGPVRRAMPPWDVPAGPDYTPSAPVEPPAAERPRLVELWTSAAVDQLLTGLGIPLSSFAYRVARDQWEESETAAVRIIAELQGVYLTGEPPTKP